MAPDLRRDSSGPEVSAWQEWMRGVDATLLVDGAFGIATEQATKQFQRSVGLPASGIVGIGTREALDGVLASLAFAAQHPTRTFGDRGDAVRAAQRRLNANERRVAVDGVFGPRMVAAVKSFQRRNGLQADGAVGSDTWAALR